MAAVVEKIDINVGKGKITGCEYAVMHEMSAFRIGKADETADFVEAECMEARFFSRTEEIRFYRKQGELECIKVSDGDGEYTDLEMVVASRFKGCGKTVVRRDYLDYDEDGQVYISGSRLVEIKEA